MAKDGELTWTGGTGGDGGPGGSGGGGGGGGAGGSRYDYWSWTVCATRIMVGGRGGDGGRAGCGGQAGTGGSAGGGSFALVVWDATVVHEGLAILLGQGGAGGRGGKGGDGVVGQAGNPPPKLDDIHRADKCMAITVWSGRGAPGGRGGNGGIGGGGAGGHGGVSVGVARVGKATLVQERGRYSTSGGTGGNGGTASYGDAGHVGQVFGEHTVTLANTRRRERPPNAGDRSTFERCPWSAARCVARSHTTREERSSVLARSTGDRIRPSSAGGRRFGARSSFKLEPNRWTKVTAPGHAASPVSSLKEAKP